MREALNVESAIDELLQSEGEGSDRLSLRASYALTSGLRASYAGVESAGRGSGSESRAESAFGSMPRRPSNRRTRPKNDPRLQTSQRRFAGR